MVFLWIAHLPSFTTNIATVMLWIHITSWCIVYVPLLQLLPSSRTTVHWQKVKHLEHRGWTALEICWLQCKHLISCRSKQLFFLSDYASVYPREDASSICHEVFNKTLSSSDSRCGKSNRINISNDDLSSDASWPREYFQPLQYFVSILKPCAAQMGVGQGKWILSLIHAKLKLYQWATVYPHQKMFDYC